MNEMDEAVSRAIAAALPSQDEILRAIREGITFGMPPGDVFGEAVSYAMPRQSEMLRAIREGVETAVRAYLDANGLDMPW